MEKKPIWGKADWNKMKEEWAQTDWKSVMEDSDTEAAWQEVKKKVRDLTDKFVPSRDWRPTRRPAWMTTVLLRLIRQKRKLWSKHKKQRTEESEKTYRDKEREVMKKIKKAKRALEKKIASNPVNNKQFFSYVGGQTKTRSGVGPLKVDGEPVCEEERIAQELNNYFSSIFQKPDSDPPPLQPNKCPGSKCKMLRFKPSKIKQIIRKLKPQSAPGPDGISPRFLQGMQEEISVTLSMLFEKSMEEGVVPSDWRTANVTPIFKKGSRGDPGNYRPVSLTSVPGKIMERIIKEEIVGHLERNRLLKSSQHGFTQGRSCTTNLLEFLEKATTILDNGESMDAIYLDFSKAFYMVPTARLLEKVRAHGVQGKVLKWLTAWLSNRTQRVVLKGKTSDWKPVTSGVPQGSVLGPILFAIYINDLEDSFEDIVTIVKKFADDTKLAQRITTDDNRALLQTCLDRLWDWGKTWGMNFNISKCHVLHFGRSNPHYSYTLGQEKLGVVEEEKDIGVTVTSNLKPGQQCEVAARKANAVLSQVLRSFTYRDKKVLPRIFKIYVRPHLEFAVPAWNPWQAGDVDRLEQVQRRLVNSVQGLAGTTYEEKLREIDLEPLVTRRQKLDLIQTFKIVQGHDRVDRSTWFSMAPEHPRYGTRSADGGPYIYQHRARLELRANFFSQRVATAWNGLKSDLKQSVTVESFENKVKIWPNG